MSKCGLFSNQFLGSKMLRYILVLEKNNQLFSLQTTCNHYNFFRNDFH